MKIKTGIIILAVLAMVAAYLFLACFPYSRQPEFTEKTAEQISWPDFFETEPGGERAMIISQNGEALAERIRLIANAKERIVLSTFDFRTDESGTILLSAMLDAAKRGVKVQLLVDGFSYFTRGWGNPYFLAAAQHENMEIKVYNPVNFLKPWKLMARLHDKYLIVDESAYILGGRNSFDYFLGDQDSYKNYDWDVLVYSANPHESDSLQQVSRYFEGIWSGDECSSVGEGTFGTQSSAVAKAEQELAAVFETVKAEHGDWVVQTDYLEKTIAVDRILLVSNPTHAGVKEPVVFSAITELMKEAGGPIVFHTPYIISNDWMTERIEEICAINPEVTMMTNSVANNGNPFGAADYLAHRAELLDTGLRILEYDSGVSYHGKCFTIGNRLSGIGSFNWDMRSVYIDTETMLVIDGEAFNTALRQEMSVYEKNALEADGQTPVKLPDGRKYRRMKILQPLVDKFRFLM